MGPSDPWSPDWRPDPTGRRRRAITAMRRGAMLAGLVYLPVAAPAIAWGSATGLFALAAVLVGLPGIALLGAGLAPAAIDSRIDAVVAGVALAIGAPVAAVTSLVIGAFLVDAFTDAGGGFAGPILRAGVTTAVGIAPAVALGAAAWVIGVRRLTPPLPATTVPDNADAAPADAEGGPGGRHPG